MAIATSTTAATATWGVTSVDSGNFSINEGVVTDFTLTTEANETSDVQDESGMAVMRKIIEEHYTFECNVTCKNDVTPPSTGDTITIGSKKYWVNSVDLTESNTEWTTCRVAGEAYSECDTITQTEAVQTEATA